LRVEEGPGNIDLVPHSNKSLSTLLQSIDLGSSVAESDTLLEASRIETSAFADLLNDRVDLVPGTKGSGKSALFRIFVDFLPDILLQQKKVVVAHGIQAPGDPVFHAYLDRFSELSENEFINFWCVYLVSLAQEQFLKGTRYRKFLGAAKTQIEMFRQACAKARIPEIEARKSLKEILDWSLNVLSSWRPKLKYKAPHGGGEIEVDLFGEKNEPVPQDIGREPSHSLPKYVNEIKEALEAVLKASGLSLWLMVDRLDEIFPRRSEVEKTALRGLLHAMRYFSSASIRVKVFLRDDMLEQVVRAEGGFTALTHVTARQADKLQWTEDQILSMVVKRFFANDRLAQRFGVDADQLDANVSSRRAAFYKIFPPTVFKGSKQSPTIRWIFIRCADGRGVVTPRDVLDLLIRAIQKQQDIFAADPDSTSDHLISTAAIQYGFEQLSKRKRETYLEAEFPHLWKEMEKFVGGKTEYDEFALRSLLGPNWKSTSDHLLAIGFFTRGKKGGEDLFSIPFLYRHGMNVTQGKA